MLNKRTKLTAAQVRDIRNRHRAGITLRQLALDFEVDFTNIWKIVHRKTHKGVV